MFRILMMKTIVSIKGIKTRDAACALENARECVLSDEMQGRARSCSNGQAAAKGSLMEHSYYL